jgi:hypothetical protein
MKTVSQAIVELLCEPPLGPRPSKRADPAAWNDWNRRKGMAIELTAGSFLPTGTNIEGAEIFIFLGHWQRVGPDRVYFLECMELGLVKIGYSSQLHIRIKELSALSPLTLRLIAAVPGGKAVEAAFHKAFSAERMHGEWFKFSDRIRVCTEHLTRIKAEKSTGK